MAVAGEVGLFGTTAVGFGFIARSADGQWFGDGEPVAGRSATAAMWLGLGEMPAPARAVFLVHFDFQAGPMVATVGCGGPWPSFGDLVWESGPVHVISSEALLAAAAAASEPCLCGEPMLPGQVVCPDPDCVTR